MKKLTVLLLFSSFFGHAQIDYEDLVRNLEDITLETDLKAYFKDLPVDAYNDEYEFNDERFLRFYDVILKNVKIANDWEERRMIMTPFNEKMDYKKLTEKLTDIYGFFILDAKGNETAVPGVDKIYDVAADNRIMASKDGKIGFIDSKGKIVIPFKYDDAKDFEDGMTAVKLNGTYKLIDVNGKILVETDEDDISFFNKDAQGKRIYRFDYGTKSYDYKGKLIEE